MADQKLLIDDPPAYDDASAPLVTPAEKDVSRQPAPRTPGGPRPPFHLDLPALNEIRGKRVILASASPRRRQLLSQVRRPSDPS